MRRVMFKNSSAHKSKTLKVSKKSIHSKYFVDDTSFSEYQDMKPKLDKSKTNLLKGLKSADVIQIQDSDVKCLKIDVERYPSKEIQELGGVLWVREFYDRLFEQIRKFQRVVLVGNPRIGKSKYQYYFLRRLLMSDEDNPLPPNHLGSTQPPEVVVRQVMNNFEVYFLKEGVVHNMGMIQDITTFLSRFKDDTTLYLFDPENLKIEPDPLTSIQTLATVSPDMKYYHFFQKIDGCVKLFFPIWTIEELLSVGAKMKSFGILPPHQQMLTDEKLKATIQEDFDEYGGILAHIFATKYRREVIKTEKSREIAKADLWKVLNRESIEDDGVSHYIAQFNVDPTEGEWAFFKRTLHITSISTYRKLLAEQKSLTWKDSALNLINTQKGKVAGQFEEHFALLMSYSSQPVAKKERKQREIRWELGRPNEEWTKLLINCDDENSLRVVSVNRSEWDCPSTLVENVLYYPQRCNFEAVDFLLKQRHGKKVVIYGIQVTAGDTHPITYNSLKTLLKKHLHLDMNEWSTFQMVFVPYPDLASTYNYADSTTSLTTLEKKKETTVKKTDEKANKDTVTALDHGTIKKTKQDITKEEKVKLDKIVEKRIVWRMPEDFGLGIKN